MSLPGRHSLLWRLAGALALFCLLLVSLHVDVGRELIEATSRVYIDAYERITGETFVPDTSGATPVDRVRDNLARAFPRYFGA